MSDIKEKYKVGGHWKARLLVKGARASRTFSKLGRTYLAKPPESGWLGGHPETNGYKPAAGR